MNYEELYKDLAPSRKAMADAANEAGRHSRAVAKALEEGNLAEAGRSLKALSAQADALKEAAQVSLDTLDGFDLTAYATSADLEKQIEESCRGLGMDVLVRAGALEIFPYRVRVVPGEGVLLGRKKIPSFRPLYLAGLIKKQRDRLYRVPFKADVFISELLEAYDTVLAKSEGKRHDGEKISLTTIYNAMVPTARAKRDYDTMAFAFDIGRLFELGSEQWVSKKGRHFDFGPGREGGSSIRVVDAGGSASYISTLRSVNR